MDPLMKSLRGVAKKRIVRSMFVGGIAAVSQTIVFEILGVLMNVVAPSTAVLIGAEVGILTNFYLNNHFNFNDRHHSTSLQSRLMRFHLVVSGSVLLQWVFVHTAENSTTNSVYIQAAYLSGIILGFVWNYTFYVLFVWKHQEKPSQKTGTINL